MEISIPLNTDTAGFISRECPDCERLFKVQHNQSSDQLLAHCPYCNHNDTGCWFTKAQAAYVGEYGAHHVALPQMAKMLKGLNTKSRGRHRSIEIKTTIKKTPPPEAPPECEHVMPTAHFSCCNETIKHDGKDKELHCIMCGVSSDCPNRTA